MTRQANYTSAVQIVERLRRDGYEALFAGGFVRDKFLGIDSDADIDIATSATPGAVASLFDHTIGVGEHFGVMLVVQNGIPFEVATFRADAGSSDGRHPDSVTFSEAATDARRRDFTINGMFYDPLTDIIIDYVGGEADLKAGIIRTIGDPVLRFREDYLRLLRAVRFAARFGFAVHPETWRQLCDHAADIHKISKERVFQELNKMLTGPHPDRALSLLEDSGLLRHILPEVHLLKGVEQPVDFHPEGDVFVHTVKILAMLNHPSQILAWSALLHDTGKPATFTHTDRIRFNNHARVGAQLSQDILSRLKSSRALMDGVYECIDNHMNFMNVSKMRLSTLKKFLSSPTIDDQLELHRADCCASHRNIDNYLFLLQKKREFAAEELRPAPLIRGRDLIELGHVPGPEFGKIISEVYDLQLDETITTAVQAREWVRTHYGALPGG